MDCSTLSHLEETFLELENYTINKCYKTNIVPVEIRFALTKEMATRRPTINPIGYYK